jgi:serralysin
VVGEAVQRQGIRKRGQRLVSGGLGNDSLEGGLGADTLSGGAGATCSPTARAISSTARSWSISRTPTAITVSLTAIDASTLNDGDQKFAFIGTSAFPPVAERTRYEVASGGSIVMGDTNGDGVADFRLALPARPAWCPPTFLL